MYDVFLSYRHESGSEFASFLYKALEDLGYRCFFDHKSLRAGPFEDRIDAAIDQCTYFLVLLSDSDLDRSIQSPDEDWIIHESKRAIERGKIIIPIAIKSGFKFPEKCEEPTIAGLSKNHACPLYGPDAQSNISSKLVKVFMQDNPAKEIRDEYNKGIISEDYLKWELKTIKNIYNDIPLVSVFGREYPSYVIAGSKRIQYPFDDLTRKNGTLLSVSDTLDYNKSYLYKEFLKIVGPNIHYPELYGYTNVGFKFDEENRICGIDSVPRTYKETVFTCHILQYELWTVYKKIGKERIGTLDDLPIRKAIHQNMSNIDVILSGCNRSALNDVTIAVIDYNERTEEYGIASALRSANVATQPGYFGFVPSGGFELYELEGNQTSNVLKENYSVIGALYREYIEELFGDVNFEKATGDDDLNRLYKNPKIRELKDGVSAGTYKFAFLGVDFDLITLRQTLSFVLRIDDDNFFYNNEIKKNDENTYVKFESLKDFEEMVQAEKLPIMPESAATYALLKNHYLYKEIAENDFKKIK